MSARAGVIVIALAALAAGCGGQGQTPAHAEIAYINRVNAIEKQLAPPLLAVSRAAAGFAAHSSPSTAAARARARASTRRDAAALAGGLARIQALRGTLAALDAPPAASRLRALILRLVDQQAYLTGQTEKLVTFLPGFTADLRPLPAATVRLERVLSISQAYGAAAVQRVYAEKAAALRQFATSVQAIIHRLRRLAVPQVSQPGYRAQIGSLRGMSVSAGKLAGAIGAGPAPAVSKLLVAFDRAAASNQTGAVRRAQIAAIKAYDAQTTRLNTLAAQAQTERARLAASLP